MSCDSSVTREVTLPLDADEAWETVTELEDWLVDDADLELEPGAEGTLTLPGGEERSARVENVEPGERLTFWWWAAEQPPTFVELVLTPAVSGTRVVVVESGAVVGAVAAHPYTPGRPSGPLLVGGHAAGAPLPLGIARSHVFAAPVAIDRLGRVPA